MTVYYFIGEYILILAFKSYCFMFNLRSQNMSMCYSFLILKKNFLPSFNSLLPLTLFPRPSGLSYVIISNGSSLVYIMYPLTILRFIYRYILKNSTKLHVYTINDNILAIELHVFNLRDQTNTIFVLVCF